MIGGALAPIIATALLSSTGGSTAVSVYCAVTLLVTIVCVVIAKETSTADIDGDATSGADLRKATG